MEFDSSDERDILNILRFALLFVQSVEFHRCCNGTSETKQLVDRNGKLMLRKKIDVIGNRVLVGLNEHAKMKTFKFYACKETEEKVLAAEKAAPGYHGVAELVEGCADDGMHAVLDDFHLSWHRITYKQLIQLTRKVDTLYKASWVHGYLLLANIIFCFDNVTAIIDWEWAGPVGTTRFPLNVNKGVFGRLASSHVSSGGLIPPDFDFLCLSDLLEDLKCFTAAAQAYVCNAQGVID